MDEAGKRSSKIGDMPESPREGKHIENRGNAKTKMSPLINLVWRFVLFFSEERGANRGRYRRRIQTDATGTEL